MNGIRTAAPRAVKVKASRVRTGRKEPPDVRPQDTATTGKIPAGGAGMLMSATSVSIHARSQPGRMAGEKGKRRPGDRGTPLLVSVSGVWALPGGWGGGKG